MRTPATTLVVPKLPWVADVIVRVIVLGIGVVAEKLGGQIVRARILGDRDAVVVRDRRLVGEEAEVERVVDVVASGSPAVRLGLGIVGERDRLAGDGAAGPGDAVIVVVDIVVGIGGDARADL